MKLISYKPHNDNETLDLLAKNPRLASYPVLRQVQASIEAEYSHYREVKGNVLKLNNALPLPVGLAESIIKHYAGSIVALRFIKKIRKALSPRVCPMCGSPKTGQVDHVAPKDEYPEFAVFSCNLVPACDCNGLKGTAFRDAAAGQRILHPYYDKVLTERLIYLRFDKNHGHPIIEVELVVAFSNDVNVRYHVDNIIRKTNVVEFAIQLWGQLLDDPDSLLFLREDGEPISDNDVEIAVGKLLSMKDREFGTPNNWFSMFYWGILVSSGKWAVKAIRRRINELRLQVAS